jgi:hypothetical protein
MVFCCITYPDRTGYNTMATSVFAAAANASNGLRCIAAPSEPPGDSTMRKSCESAWGWCRTAGIACQSDGFASGEAEKREAEAGSGR